jgi:predicted GIY-YIG superfamily endonuclease
MKYIIYKISIADYIYIGSTRDFKQRKIEHKSRFNKEYTYKVYEIIRENGGWDKCEVIPIEEYECENNTQARIREEYWRREYEAQMNSRKAYISMQEYKEIVKEPNKERCKKWYEANKDRINEIRREKKTQCECGAIICENHVSRHIKTKRHIDRISQQQNNLIIL